LIFLRKGNGILTESVKAILIGIVILVTAGMVLVYGFPGLIIDGAKWFLRWQAGLTTKEIRADDHRWVYLHGGRGEPILLVHGFGGEKHQWGFLPKALSPSHELIIPDLPGFGESSQIDSAVYDIPSQVNRLNRFVEALGLQSFHLLGISMGGYIAGYYASEYPGKVKSLGLMSAAGVRSRVESTVWKRYREEGRILLLYKTETELEELMSVLFFKPPPVPRPFKRYLAEKGKAHYSFYEKILRDMEKGGDDLLEGRLVRVTARSLVIWGANDQITHVSSVEKFEKELRDCRAVILENCGHVPYFDQGKKTIGVYKDFLASLPKQGKDR
jgi:abhydrolase domain-containing protein 6